MPCGNIDPFGITGTPVIDFASRTLYVDAMVTPDDAGATKKHLIYALSIDDGVVRSGWPIDVAAKAKSGSTAFVAQYQGQRAALALVGGTLYVPFGGLYGDCGQYRGEVVGWVINHEIAPKTVRMTCSFVRADLARRARILPLYTASLERLRASGCRQCLFVTPVTYGPMVDFVKNRCEQWVTFVGETRGVAKSL